MAYYVCLYFVGSLVVAGTGVFPAFVHIFTSFSILTFVPAFFPYRMVFYSYISNIPQFEFHSPFHSLNPLPLALAWRCNSSLIVHTYNPGRAVVRLVESGGTALSCIHTNRSPGNPTQCNEGVDITLLGGGGWRSYHRPPPLYIYSGCQAVVRLLGEFALMTQREIAILGSNFADQIREKTPQNVASIPISRRFSKKSVNKREKLM